MVVTRGWILANRTTKGAWTRPQIESLGVKWPPTKGWMHTVIGSHISDSNKVIFESKATAKEVGISNELDEEHLNSINHLI